MKKTRLVHTMQSNILLFLTIFVFLFSIKTLQAQTGSYASLTISGRSAIINSSTGEKIRITPYGDYMVRVQTVKKSEDFYADDRYEMVETHDWNGKLSVDSSGSSINMTTSTSDGISLKIDKSPLRLSFSIKNSTESLLKEKDGVSWSGNVVTASFVADATEHFAGLGHELYGKIAKLDRKGTSLKVSKASEGVCIVPFFVSSKGYGVFLNTTFTHTITLCKSDIYSLAIDGEGYGGQMDFFFIAGPSMTQVIDRYTQLTGRPRLPQKSMFGLHLSDKADPTNAGESWWKQTINNHRNAGFAIDHQVNDNVWRKSTEAVSTQGNSWFEFGEKYDPPEYKKWCDANGITVTLDLNRPNITKCYNWNNTTLGIPGSTACPDFTNKNARKWIWDLFYAKAFDPALGYPGDAIWLDEFDYPDHAHSTTLSSGKKWAEEAINYHFDLLKACVHEGWDPVIGESKRPYFWSRGITAGAQRFGQYWTGDLNGDYATMQDQVRAMQSAGISGFPYFNHDAGGHLNLTINTDNCFRQWDMGFGSFTPLWKPHGPSHSRWPLKYNSTCQATAKTFITTRYEMLPYIYTYAYQAHATGIPMARSMFLDDQNNATAWSKDMQYYWGKEMLVAPNCSDGNNAVSVWLPKANWYDFWNDKKYTGDQTLNYQAATGVVPAFVKEGSIIPMAPFAKSTFFIPKDTVIIHVYTGADGSFQLYEDDGVTEKFRTKNEFCLTDLHYRQDKFNLEVGASKGTYTGAPAQRSWQIVYHGLTESIPLFLNTSAITSYTQKSSIPANQNGSVWNTDKKILTAYISSRAVNSAFSLASEAVHVQKNQYAEHVIRNIVITNDNITIQRNTSCGLKVSIALLDGKVIHFLAQPPRTSEQYQIYSIRDLKLSKGTYLLRVTTDNTVLNRRFIVR